METFMVCMIIIVSMIVFAILVCKLSSKLELKSQYEKPIPNNLLPATEEEKDLLRYSYTLVGTIYGGKYTNSHNVMNIVKIIRCIALNIF